MELRHLRYFVTVAETLHFGRAAERLHIAQPALSVQIKDLETKLGGKLFRRNNRNVTLTDAGRLLLEEARAVLAQVEHFRTIANRALRGELGLVRIGYSGNAAYSGVLAEALQAFKAEQPEVELQLLEMDPRSQMHALKTLQIDAGFLTALTLEVPAAFAKIQLADLPLSVALPEKHPLTRKSRIPIGSLTREDFVVYGGADSHDGRDFIRALGGFEPHIAHRTNSPMAILALVGAGQGIAIVANLLNKVAPTRGVEFRPLADAPGEMDVSLLHWETEQEPVVLRFIDCVRRHFAPAKA
jgi:DNA-binding transcriptional LysR family regulator